MEVCLGYDGCGCFNCKPKPKFRIERFGMSEWIICSDCGKKLGLISHICKQDNRNVEK